VKAEGGWAGICTEYAPVSLDSDESPYISAQLWDEDDVRNLALMADAVHEHGSLAGIELTHSGMHAQMAETRWPAIAPSQLAGDYHPSIVPKAMEKDDIRRVQGDWVRAAQQARSVGFDIVYVYGGHSYLLTQFLSPFYNKRTDEYGGSLANRARMWLETLEAVREAIGDECAVAVRVGVDLTPGVEVDDALEFIRLADHLVDLARFSSGRRTRASRASTRRAISSSGPAGCERRPRSPSSASRGSRTRIEWRRSSARAPGT
jgi:dimethylamine/trimethylamine dehydrogenase